MTCGSCGAENPRGRFCAKCGTPLQTSQPSPPTAESSPMPGEASMIGRIIDGKYKIESTLGEGGMGVVYRASRVMIGDIVALKLLRATTVQGSGSGERFRREAQAAARLKHPNAVAIYDFGITADGLSYLVMELIDGESLTRVINRGGALPMDFCLPIMRQVLAAVGEGHRQNIIHRDLKPDNIILSGSGPDVRVKVLDFGIAKLNDTTSATLTQAGTVVGTPHYMSPEQCLGEPLDGRSDLYSLGIVLFQMLTGKVPFTATTPTAIVIMQVTQPPPAPRTINPAISPAVEAVILRVLSKKRDDRPRSADELYQELLASGTPEPIPGETRMGSAMTGAQANRAGDQMLTPTAAPPVYTGAPGPVAPSGVGALGAPSQGWGGAPGSGSAWNPTGQPASNPQLTAPGAAVVPQRRSGGTILAVIGIVAILIAIGTVVFVAFFNKPHRSRNENLLGRRLTQAEMAQITSDVTQTLNGWSEAINSRDLERVMSYYADPLQPYYLMPSAQTRKVREDMQKAFSEYSSTSVQVSDLSVDADGDGLRATAKFNKTFNFDGAKQYNGSVREQMSFAKAGGRWLISGVQDLRKIN